PRSPQFHLPRLRHVPRAARNARLVLIALAVPLVGLIALSIGSVQISLADVWGALVHPSAGGGAHTIVWDLRLPRVLIAMAVGAGLGLAGALLQTLFRNPLVDPYITGVSAGAAVAAAAGFTLGLAFAFIPALAFAGGLVCAAIVAAIGSGDSASGNLRLVLAGVAISALASALVMLILLQRGSDSSLGILAWLAGGINGRGWSDLGPMAAYLSVATVLAFAQVHTVNLLRLGNAAAQGFGLRLAAARWQILATASLITAACVAVSGVVGFVGLMVPHAVRRLVSGDARWLLAGSALGGAIVVVVADVLARTVMAPAEVPLDVLLAFVGVPFFLLVARRPVEL
ncbi:MAG TPA: iron ABC transporter permease, partial [Candidatus Eremiobacteraceae bacterium]|nr:iron ABC transporter permease [Candidatus Eremiobacteraceae bacterium]